MARTRAAKSCQRLRTATLGSDTGHQDRTVKSADVGNQVQGGADDDAHRAQRLCGSVVDRTRGIDNRLRDRSTVADGALTTGALGSRCGGQNENSPIVRGGKCEIVEGEARMRQVVLEFDSYEQAKTYFFSPEYQAARKLRNGISIGDLVVVEGVE